MAKTNSRKSVRFVYKRSSLMLKCVLLVTIVLSAVALTAIRIRIVQCREQTDATRAQAAQQEQRRQELQQHLADKDTVQGIKNIAEEELDLVDPDSQFFGAP